MFKCIKEIGVGWQEGCPDRFILKFCLRSVCPETGNIPIYPFYTFEHSNIF